MKNDKINPINLSSEQAESLLSILQSRFEDNTPRHEGLEWAEVQAKLEADPQKLRSLNEMERTGGATFGDRRYDTVWVYHNGAYSYYAARGSRASLRV